MTALADPTRRTVFERLREGPRSVGRARASACPSPAQPFRSTSASSSRPASSASAARGRATSTASTETRSPSCASTSRASGRTRSRPSRKPQRKESPMSQQTSEAVIRKSVVVRRPVERGFRALHTDIATWWPVKTHSVAQENAETVVFERTGRGQVLRANPRREEHLWGTVTVWEPPRSSPAPGTRAAARRPAQEIEVVFTAAWRWNARRRPDSHRLGEARLGDG